MKPICFVFTGGLPALFLAALVLTIAVVIGGFMWWRMRLCRKHHLRANAPMSDEAILSNLAIPPHQRRACLAIRKAMARAVGVPPDSIHPSDSMESLCALGFDGVDLIEVIVELEKELGVHIDEGRLEEAYQGKDPMQMTFAQFVSCCLLELERQTL